MITNYCMIICFIMIGINFIVIYSELKKMDKLYISWREHTLHLEKELNNLYSLQRDNGKSINEVFKRIHSLEKSINEEFKRIHSLEDRLEGQEAWVATLEEKLKTSGGEE